MIRLEKTEDRDLVHIEPVHEKHIPQMKSLWNTQYAKMAEKYDFLPRKWLSDPAPFAHFIEQDIDSRCSTVATLGTEVIGFMTCDEFDFHGEKTAFFPIMAHAAHESLRLVAYNMLYTHISQQLVEAGCINHILTFFAGDHTLQEYLFELGFGLYVVDAYRDISSIPNTKKPHDITVRKAESGDVDVLLLLVKETDGYYAQAPLFLKRVSEEKDELASVIASPDHAVFLAMSSNQIVGFMCIRCRHDDDVVTLSDTTTACIDPLGAYITKAYRGLGIGEQLLYAAITWGRQHAVCTIHVDFESANTYARQFWPKHFAPILYSVKRHLNADIG